jgi:hypothetical protein
MNLWPCNGAQISGTNTTRLVGHMEFINQAAQAYVMLGRIQWISQLYLSSFDAVKIKINQEALSEAYRLSSIAINTKPSWHETSHFKISHLNICSHRKHIDDLQYDPWLSDNAVNNEQIELYCDWPFVKKYVKPVWEINILSVGNKHTDSMFIFQRVWHSFTNGQSHARFKFFT